MLLVCPLKPNTMYFTTNYANNVITSDNISNFENPCKSSTTVQCNKLQETNKKGHNSEI
jgi:hypothetical protein